MKKLIDDFNKFFKGNANIIIKNDELEITVGTLTMVISLPEMTVGYNKPKV